MLGGYIYRRRENELRTRRVKEREETREKKKKKTGRVTRPCALLIRKNRLAVNES